MYAPAGSEGPPDDATEAEKEARSAASRGAYRTHYVDRWLRHDAVYSRAKPPHADGGVGWQMWLLPGQTQPEAETETQMAAPGGRTLDCFRSTQLETSETPEGQVERQFTGLLVLTGCTVAFAHGAPSVRITHAQHTRFCFLARKGDGPSRGNFA